VEISWRLTERSVARSKNEDKYISTHPYARHQVEISCQLHAPSGLFLGKWVRYLLDEHMSNTQVHSARAGEEKMPCQGPQIILVSHTLNQL
jgi:hypothetical protein